MSETIANTSEIAAAAPATYASKRSTIFWPAALTLWRREMVRFFRQRNRVVSALVTPVLFWLMLGSGLNKSFQNVAATSETATSATAPADAAQAAETAGNVGYMVYFFPGTVTMILLFTAIFSTITVIEDRREGFLQGVLVSPASRLSIAWGKVMGGASIAMIHALVFLLIWPFVAPEFNLLESLPSLLAAIGVMAILAIGLTGLGVCVAWPMDSTAAFHAVMMLFLMPMWFLSGAVFPVESAPKALQFLMLANPLTYGHEVFATVLTGGQASTGVPVNFWLCLVMTIVCAFGAVAIAGRMVARPRKDGMP